jgi:glycosyltransferase involved in cell wall biosynthesis
MRVALITDNIDDASPGLSRYTRRLAEELVELGRRFEVTFVHRQDTAFYRGRSHVVVANGWGKLVRKQVVMPSVLSRSGFDLVHDPYHFPPFLWPVPYARVMTIADLTPLFLRTHTWARRFSHRVLLRRLARRADHVLTISEHTKRDAIRHLGLPEARVTATPLAADESLAPIECVERIDALRERYALPPRYLLHVGTIEPRKNLRRLVEAFGHATRSHRDVALVLAGAPGWGDVGLEEAIAAQGLDGRVRLLGFVAEGDLPALYTGAQALVYPSLYEGFGLPPLEAMQCGCPVVTSNVSSLPEVVGDAGLQVEPTSVAELAQAIERVLDDSALRQRLRQAGLERAKLFTWRRTAEVTADVYEQVLASRG